MLTGMRGGFTKYCCFLCLWDSRSTAEHYVKGDWQPRDAYEPGKSSIEFLPLVEPRKIFLPLLHIKLGLMKNHVEAIGKGNSCSFQYHTERFPNISGVKMNEGLFIGPQIKSVLLNEGFKQSLSTAEFKAWEELKWLCKSFLGIHKFSAYMEGVQLLLDSYQKLGCRMSLKINTLLALRPRVLSRKSCHGE